MSLSLKQLSFWDVGLAKKTYSKILQSLTQHLAKKLGVMCVTSTLEAGIEVKL